MSVPEDTQHDIELGPLFAAGVIALAYGLLRRKQLPVALGIGAMWLDQRSEFGRSVKKRADAALKGQIKAHARPDSQRSAWSRNVDVSERRATKRSSGAAQDKGDPRRAEEPG